MSEQPVAAPARPKPPGKQYLGLSRNQWFLVGGVFVAAVGYILWRRHQAAKSSSSSTTTSTSTATASELAALQNELDQLQSQGFGSSGGFAGGGGTAGTGGPAAYSTTTATPAGTPTASNGTTSTGTGATATATKAGPISNLQASNVGTTTATIKWNPAANASGGYAYKVTQLNGTVVKSDSTSSTSVSLSGLHPGWTYNFGVQGLPGGFGDNIHFSTKSG